MLMKITKILIPFLCMVWLVILFLSIEPITDFFVRQIENEPKITLEPISEYAKKEDFLFVSKTDVFTPYSMHDLRNIFYTIVNNGWKEFTFYCPSEYTNCLNDAREFSQDQDLLTHLNNFVHPFNGFSSVNTNF